MDKKWTKTSKNEQKMDKNEQKNDKNAKANINPVFCFFYN
jgi:hypothetical protein